MAPTANLEPRIAHTLRTKTVALKKLLLEAFGARYLPTYRHILIVHTNAALHSRVRCALQEQEKVRQIDSW